ncbi:MAG: hypothetical protein QM742_08070 [Aquabacterium sp.]
MKSLFLRLWHSPTFMTWGSLASRLLGMTLVLPILLVKFPAAEVAIWQLFITLYTMQMLFDFGFAPTFSRLLAYAYGGATMQELSEMHRKAPMAGAERETRPSSCTSSALNAGFITASPSWCR